jgi:nucleoside-diphosphate-sugar epimerase
MILVTGGTGLLGSQLLFDLASSGKKVRALKRADSDMHVYERLFQPFPQYKNNVEWVVGDVLDLFSLEDALEGIETVYHAAAFISFYPADRNKMMKINVEGVANMVNMAMNKNVKRFCHVSSVAALGPMNEGEVLDENTWWKTSKVNSNYAISKYGGEREVWRGIEEGLNAFIINPSIIIGPGNWKSGSTIIFEQIWNGLSFYAEGIAGFVDVRDVSKSAIALMEKGIKNERFIISAENLSYRYVFDSIAQAMGKRKAFFKVTPFLSEVGWRLEQVRSFIVRSNPIVTRELAMSAMMQCRYSNEKIVKEIGIEFISIDKAIENAVRYFKMDQESKFSG